MLKKRYFFLLFFYSDYTNLLINYGFLHNFVGENLGDKVSKIKNLKWQFGSIFRWLCRGVFIFSVNLVFTEKFTKQNEGISKKVSILFCKFLYKNKVDRKNEDTTTKPTELFNCHLIYLAAGTLNIRAKKWHNLGSNPLLVNLHHTRLTIFMIML